MYIYLHILNKGKNAP